MRVQLSRAEARDESMVTSNSVGTVVWLGLGPSGAQVGAQNDDERLGFYQRGPSVRRIDPNEHWRRRGKCEAVGICIEATSHGESLVSRAKAAGDCEEPGRSRRSRRIPSYRLARPAARGRRACASARSGAPDGVG